MVKLPAIMLATCIAASAIPSTGPAGDAARGVDAGVVEAGDDVAVVAGGLALAHLVDQTRHGERLVVVALDAGRPHAPGETATISVPGAATARAAAPIFSVMEWVVLGLTTRMRIGPGTRAGQERPQRRGRPPARQSRGPADCDRALADGTRRGACEAGLRPESNEVLLAAHELSARASRPRADRGT